MRHDAPLVGCGRAEIGAGKGSLEAKLLGDHSPPARLTELLTWKEGPGRVGVWR